MTKQLDLFEEIVAEVTVITKKKSKPRSSSLSKKDFDLLEYKRILNQEPPKKLLKTNKEFGNKYIPLQVIEQMLQAIFDAYEIVIPFAPVLIEGQVLTTVNLIVHHPVLKIPLTYSGTSCVPLIAADNQQMKWNHRNIPAGKGFAIMNASKEIGQIFRAEKDDYTDVMRDYFDEKQKVKDESPEVKAKEELKKRLLEMIKASKTVESLIKKEQQILKLNDKEVDEAYSERFNELKPYIQPPSDNAKLDIKY